MEPHRLKTKMARELSVTEQTLEKNPPAILHKTNQIYNKVHL